MSRKGVDIMVLLDVSRRMLVEDVKPNRLERATLKIIDFLKVVEGYLLKKTEWTCYLSIFLALLENKLLGKISAIIGAG